MSSISFQAQPPQVAQKKESYAKQGAVAVAAVQTGVIAYKSTIGKEKAVAAFKSKVKSNLRSAVKDLPTEELKQIKLKELLKIQKAVLKYGKIPVIGATVAVAAGIGALIGSFIHKKPKEVFYDK